MSPFGFPKKNVRGWGREFEGGGRGPRPLALSLKYLIPPLTPSPRSA
jgi:hypothetical protein